MAHYRKSAKVEWRWLGRPVKGTVQDIFKTSVTKTIKGKKITRHGSDEKPAYLVKSEAGNLALKLETELSALTKKSTPARRAAAGTARKKAPRTARPKLFADK